VSGTGSPVLRFAVVARPVEEAFDVFTRQIGAWWPLPSHGVFGADAGGLAFEDGLLVERAVDGRASVWGEVLAWEPPDRLVVTWHPGSDDDAEPLSEVEVRFSAVAGGTRVELEHRGWERFGAQALARRRRYVGPGAWGHVLDHFADGAEVRPDAVDVAALRDAYARFFAEAEQGGFEEPEPGQWDAREVLAHVALNDLALTAVAHALVHRRSDVTFGNTTCQDPAVLAHHIEMTGDLAALVSRGRRLADVATAAVLRLDASQRGSVVPCRLLHDGEVVLDAALPWVDVAVETQAARHLPAHTAQLQDLRHRPRR
jgi:uncharacterized protein YndB with AHSA1/START domain